MAHNLLSPKKHISKVYYVKTKECIDEEQLRQLEKGVDIGEGGLTLPAIAEKKEEQELLLTIYEGKFHQVKRMLKAVGNEVVYLKRIQMGKLALDNSLEIGEYRKLTDKELEILKDN